MSRTEAIAVFAYAFPHRKTQDFLLELAAAGYRNVTVVAAPWKQLSHCDPATYFPTQLRNASPVGLGELCAAFGFALHECEHDDAERIAILQREAGFELAIISGARIIKQSVIDIFAEGILNIHPGKLPETAGLDLFYHSIAKNAVLGVTAHFIDARVDAGNELFFEETLIGPDDSVETVQHNNYQSQLRALRCFIRLRDEGALRPIPVDRPKKNEPMSPDMKRAVLASFPDWRAARYIDQKLRALFTACRDGDKKAVESLLVQHPQLISARSTEGWTPLIVASFNQRADCVRALLQTGADPNEGGRKGTTPLMYAKTALLQEDYPDFAVLDLLLQAGADPARRDAAGKDIWDYLADVEGHTIIDHIKKWQEHT